MGEDGESIVHATASVRAGLKSGGDGWAHWLALVVASLALVLALMSMAPFRRSRLVV